MQEHHRNIHKLMIENKRYLELGKNAKEYVSKFNWKKIILEYKKILN